MATPVNERNFGNGLDQYSAETMLAEGYVADVLNFSPQPNGSLVKRKGWVAVGGRMPLRVRGVTRVGSTDNYDIQLYDVDLTGADSAPVVVGGRTIAGVVGKSTIMGIGGSLSSFWSPSFVVMNSNTIRVECPNSFVSGWAEDSYLPDEATYVAGKVGVDMWVWGIEPAQTLLGDNPDTDRSTWVTSLSRYIVRGTSTLAATYRGNLHILTPGAQIPGGPAAQSPQLVDTVDGNYVIGRAIYSATPTLAPKRGFIVVPGTGTEGWLPVEDAEYHEDTGLTSYRMRASGATLSPGDQLTDVIRPDLDYLRVQQTGWDVLDGEFEVIDAQLNDGWLTVWVENEGNDKPDTKRSSYAMGARAGVFTDLLDTEMVVSAKREDRIEIDGLIDPFIVLNQDELVISGVNEPIQLTDEQLVSFHRRTNILPIGQTGFVVGDQVSVAGEPHTFQVIEVSSDEVTIDQTIELSPDSVVTLTERWLGVPGVPATSRTQTAAYVQHHSLREGGIEDAELPHVAMIKGCLYFSNYYDPIQKYDGQAVYAAGLIPFSPSVGISVIPYYQTTLTSAGFSTTGTIAGGRTKFDPADAADTGAVTSGDRVVLRGQFDSARLGVGSMPPQMLVYPRLVSIRNSDGDVSITTVVEGLPDSNAAELFNAKTYRYYYRFRITDARGNVTYSAATQSQDLSIVMGKPSAVVHSLLQYPPIGFLQSGNLVLQIYSTGISEQGEADSGLPFYKIAEIPMSPAFTRGLSATDSCPQNYTRGKVMYVDTVSRSLTTETDTVTDLYPVGLASVGSYLYPPPRARTLTTLANRLVLGNIRSIPQMSLSFRLPASASQSSVLGSWLDDNSANPLQVILRRRGATGSAADGSTVKRFALLKYPSDGNGSIFAARHTYPTVLDDGTGLKMTGISGGSWASLSPGNWVYASGFVAANSEGMETLESASWFQVVTDTADDITVTYPFGRALYSSSSGTNTLVFPTPHGLMHGEGVMLGTNDFTPKQFQYYVSVVSTTAISLYHTREGVFDLTHAERVVIPASGARVVTVIPTQLGNATGIQVGRDASTTSGSPTMIQVRFNRTLWTGAAIRVTTGVTGITTGIYYVRVTDAGLFQFELYSTAAQALDAPSTTGRLTPGASANLVFNILSSTGLVSVIWSNNGDVPVPIADDTLSQTNQTNARYKFAFRPSLLGGVSDQGLLPEANLTRAIKMLGMAINATSAVGSPAISRSSSTVTTPGDYAWVLARWGSDAAFQSLLLEDFSCDGFSVEVRGTSLRAANTSSAVPSEAESLFVFAGEQRLPNGRIPVAQVDVDANTLFAESHAILPSDIVRVAPGNSGSTLPTGLVANTAYYPNILDKNTFSLSATRGGAPIDITAAGTGLLRYTIERQADQEIFPSRLVRSFSNFPEMFDRPYDDNALVGGSQSIIDVTPEDGEELEAIIPFYGDSFSAVSNNESMLVALKTKSAYFVNIETREISYIPTMEHGAYYPRSVSSTKDGISYADQQGVYKINRAGQWVWLGKALGRAYAEVVDGHGAAKDVPVALHDSGDNSFRLSLPSSSGATNDRVLVYNYAKEEGGASGSWTIHSTPTTISSAELEGRTYVGTNLASVYGERRVGDADDYQDGTTPVAGRVDLRPVDFGVLGSRKRVNTVSIQYRRNADVSIEGVKVFANVDNSMVYLPADEATLHYSSPDTNHGDQKQKTIYSLTYTLPERKAEYFQLRIEQDAKSPIEIVQVTYFVEDIGTKGTEHAASTTRK